MISIFAERRSAFSWRRTASRALAVALLATLSACVPPDRTPLPPTEGDRGSPRYETAEETRPLSQQYTGTGAIPERLLPSGILDVGNRDAPLVLLTVTEHHCRYCRDFLRDLFPRIRSEYIDRGLLRYQVMILPLRKYPGSRDAAAALLCGAQQGKGMAMHALLFEKEERTPAALPGYAQELGIDAETFRICLESESTESLLAEQESWARSLGVSLVPTFFLNGEKFVGLPYEQELFGRLERALQEAR